MAIKQLSEWLSAGKLVSKETVVEGFENIPKAFSDLFEGKNIGKMVIKIQTPSTIHEQRLSRPDYE